LIEFVIESCQCQGTQKTKNFDKPFLKTHKEVEVAGVEKGAKK
jgi:hypothetical protein